MISRTELIPGSRSTCFPNTFAASLPEKRAVWDVVGRALCSGAVKQAFIQRLAPGLRGRFGADFADVGMYPIPILTRDIPGYRIPPHPDSRWKGITVQLYLPRDNTMSHIGTIFHERLPDGSLPTRTQMKFSPNTGYAFAVADDTWHSADTVGPEVTTRDSILLTYFVDAGLLRVPAQPRQADRQFPRQRDPLSGETTHRTGTRMTKASPSAVVSSVRRQPAREMVAAGEWFRTTVSCCSHTRSAD